jgi:signal transduction histidine kinase
LWNRLYWLTWASGDVAVKSNTDRHDGPGFLSTLFGKGTLLIDSAKRLKTRGTQLALAFAGFVLAVIWLSIGSFCVSEWHSVHTEAEHDLTGAQTVLRAHISRTYNAARNMLILIDDWLASRSSAGSKESIDDLIDVILQLQRHDEQPIAIRLINSADSIIRSVPEKTGQINVFVGDRDYIHALTNSPVGTIYISPPILSRISNTTVLPIAIHARPNAFDIKYISAAIPAADLTSAYGQLLTESPATVGVIKADGTVLLTVPQSDSLPGKVFHGTSDVIATQPAGTSGLSTLPSFVDGTPTLMAYARLAREPLAVFATFDEYDLRWRWLHRVALPFLLAIMSSVVVLAFTHWLLRLMRNSLAEAEKLAAALVDAQAANQSKQHFLANMSHELRTPLNAIIGFSELLTSESFGPLGNPSYRGYAQDILDAGRHLLAIIKDILDAAKMDAGKIELSDTPIRIAELLGDCEHMLAPRFADKKLTLSRHIPENLPALRMGAVHMKRILINLVGNAIKFTPPGGRIDATATIAASGELSLVIADTGIGIPPSRIGKLFRPFSQVEESLNRNHDGIGLGLVNTRLIVEAYGGRVWLESQFGHGTQVHVLLPADRLVCVPERTQAS